MKKLLSLSILFLALFSVGCVNSEPVIVKQETKNERPVHNPELVEEKNEENKTNTFIEFFSPKEVVTVNLNMVPILKQYLQSVQDREQTVRRMNLIPIHDDYATLYLLEFSCYQESCSYILIDQNQDNRSHLIADLSQYIQMEFSPDMQKIFLQFNRPTDFSVSLGHAVVVNLQDWTILDLAETEVSILNYSNPILEINWADNDSLSFIIPHFFELNEKNITNWNENNNPTQTVILSIDD